MLTSVQAPEISTATQITRADLIERIIVGYHFLMGLKGEEFWVDDYELRNRLVKVPDKRLLMEAAEVVPEPFVIIQEPAPFGGRFRDMELRPFQGWVLED